MKELLRVVWRLMKRRTAIGALTFLRERGTLYCCPAAGEYRMCWPRVANVLLMGSQAPLPRSWVYALAYRELPEPFHFYGDCGGVQ
jgi:hypothetical protein